MCTRKDEPHFPLMCKFEKHIGGKVSAANLQNVYGKHLVRYDISDMSRSNDWPVWPGKTDEWNHHLMRWRWKRGWNLMSDPKMYDSVMWIRPDIVIMDPHRMFVQSRPAPNELKLIPGSRQRPCYWDFDFVFWGNAVSMFILMNQYDHDFTKTCQCNGSIPSLPAAFEGFGQKFSHDVCSEPPGGRQSSWCVLLEDLRASNITFLHTVHKVHSQMCRDLPAEIKTRIQS